MTRPRRPGRRPLDEHDRSVPLSAKVTGRQYNELYDRAQRERVTMAELVRRALDSSKKNS